MDPFFERNYHVWLVQQHQLFVDRNDLHNLHQLQLRFDRRLNSAGSESVSGAKNVDEETLRAVVQQRVDAGLNKYATLDGVDKPVR